MGPAGQANPKPGAFAVKFFLVLWASVPLCFKLSCRPSGEKCRCREAAIESYIGLFLTAFLAATIVPFSSEALLVGMQVSGGFSLAGLLAAASLGNILGAAVNWALGRFCLHWQDR